MDDEFGGGDIGGFDDGGSADLGGGFADEGGADLGGGLFDDDSSIAEIPEDADNEGMFLDETASLESANEVAAMQEEGNAEFEEEISNLQESGFLPTETEMSEEDEASFIAEQDAFEESVMDGSVHDDDVEPGAELSHGEFFEEQDAFEQSIMDGSDDDIDIPEDIGAEEFESTVVEDDTSVGGDEIPEDVESSEPSGSYEPDDFSPVEEDTITQEDDSEFIKIGGESVNPESPYVIDRETSEVAGYTEGDEVIDSELAQEELALPDSNPADHVHDMSHISEDTHDLYVSDVASTKDGDDFSAHEGGGEQTVAIRQDGELLDGYAGKGEEDPDPEYTPEHMPGEEGVIDDRKELDDFSDADWESAYVENEIYDSVEAHNENYSDNKLDFYQISNSGENFRRGDGSSALEDYQENYGNFEEASADTENTIEDEEE